MRRRLRRERSGTEWSHAMAQQLLTRYGVVFRETAHAEDLPGGFSAVYDVLKAMEESGKIRRGYFAADLGATQFAMPAAVDLLRSLRVQQERRRVEMLLLAATDPANPYGALLRWPAAPDAGSSLTRSVGARVILVRWRAGGLSAARESECAGVSAGGGAGAVAGGAGAGGVSGAAGAGRARRG